MIRSFYLNKYFIFIILVLGLLSCSGKDDSIRIYESEKIQVKTKSMAAPTNEGLSSVKRNFMWKTPKNWEEEEGNSIRVGSFSIKGLNKNKGKEADASIVVLGGRAGGSLMNINRWRGQIALAAIDESTLKSVLNNDTGKLGDFKFTFIKNKKTGKGIIASIFSTASRTVFVKMSGPIVLLESQKEIFLKFSRQIYEN